MQVLRALAAGLTAFGLSSCSDTTTPEKVETALVDRVVFLNTRLSGAGDIYSIRIDGSELTKLTQPGSLDQCPALSPDGKFIVLIRDGSLGKMRSDGSEFTFLVPPNFRPTSSYYTCPRWSADGTRLAFVLKGFAVKQSGSAALYTVGASGNDLKLLLDGWEASEALWSPGGDRLLYVSNSYTSGGPYNFSTNLINADGGGQRRIPAAGGDMTWSPTGDQMAFTCPHSTSNTPIRRICVADGEGNNAVSLTSEPGRSWNPKWSPDGRFIAYSCDNDICLIEPDGSGMKKLTSRTGYSNSMVWAPDSKRLLYSCPAAGVIGPTLCVINADGTGDRELVSIVGNNSSGSWSPLSN